MLENPQVGEVGESCRESSNCSAIEPKMRVVWSAVMCVVLAPFPALVTRTVYLLLGRSVVTCKLDHVEKIRIDSRVMLG